MLEHATGSATHHTDPAPADPSVPCCGPLCPLASMRPGEVGIVAELRIDGSDRTLLDAMGLRTSARVRVCRSGRTCIVVADESCRLGVERRLAERVMVARSDA